MCAATSTTTRSSMRRRKKYEDDDGRVVAKMNVEGMPWYCPGASDSAAPSSGEQLSRHETLLIILSSMKWAFLASAILCAFVVLFILFCVKVWFRA